MPRTMSRLQRAITYRQAGCLVCDGSPSMLDPVHGEVPDGVRTKGQAVGWAVSGLLDRFRQSGSAANFSFAGVAFNSRVHSTWGPTAAADLDPAAGYDPTGGGGGTSIAAGLEAARGLVRGFLDAEVDGLPSSAVILVCSDGQCGTPDQTRRIATELKTDERVTIACAFFATAGSSTEGLDLLKEISSDPMRFCTVVYDPETLRRFWMATMEASVPGALPVLHRHARLDQR